MAYQNVSTPRFYIDSLSLAKSVGYSFTSIPTGGEANIGFNPSKIYTQTPPAGEGHYSLVYYRIAPLLNLNLDFCVVLAHNYSGADTQMYLQDGEGWHNPIMTAIVNGGYGGGTWAPEYNGFTILQFDDTFTPRGSGLEGFQLYANPTIVDKDYKIGSFAMGTIYTMPHSPDLSLTMSREYGGTKEFTT